MRDANPTSPIQESPLYCPLAPPSIEHAICPVPHRLLAACHAPPRHLRSYWFLFHVILSQSFLLAQATPSYLSPDSTFSLGSSPSHLSFILHLVLGAWGMGVNQTHPTPLGVQETVRAHGPTQRQ